MKKQLIFKSYKIQRDLPENYRMEDKRHFDGDIHNTIREIYITELKNVTILQLYVFLKLRILEQYCTTKPLDWKKKLKAYVKMIFFKSIKIDQATWIIDNWSAGYFHWITDVMPRILTAKKFLPEKPILLPIRYKELKFVQETISEIDINVIYYQPYIKYEVKQMGFTSHLKSCEYNEVLIREVRSELTKDIAGFKESPKKRIYISRSKAKRRRITNEESLQSLLNEFNIECYTMEDLTFEQQRLLMAQTQFLISNHGAGLTNMTFMQKGAIIFELKSDSKNINNCFFNLARALNHHYYYTINPGNSTNIQYTDIEVDLEVLKTELSKIFSTPY